MKPKSLLEPGVLQIFRMFTGVRLALVGQTIIDDGGRFDLLVPNSSHLYDLVGTRERIEMIGGQFSVKRKRGSGTQISLSYASAV